MTPTPGRWAATASQSMIVDALGHADVDSALHATRLYLSCSGSLTELYEQVKRSSAA